MCFISGTLTFSHEFLAIITTEALLETEIVLILGTKRRILNNVGDGATLLLSVN